MIRKVLKIGSCVIYSGLLPFSLNWDDWDIDKIKQTNKTAQAFYNRNLENETGWDRLYLMFSVDEFQNVSPELNSTIQAGLMGVFVGACYGGVLRSRAAYMNFIEQNQATAFKSHFDAKKKLQDTVTINFGKGAFQWGWRLGLFTFTYVGVTTTIAVYRGKTGILEYIAAGCVTGSLYKFNLGPRAMLVGGVLGGILGSIAGVASYGITKLTGMSLEEARYWQYQWKQDRQQKINQAFKHNENNQIETIYRAHDIKTSHIDVSTSLDHIPNESKSK